MLFTAVLIHTVRVFNQLLSHTRAISFLNETKSVFSPLVTRFTDIAIVYEFMSKNRAYNSIVVYN